MKVEKETVLAAPEPSGLSMESLASLDAIGGEEVQASDDIEQEADQAAQKQAAASERESTEGWLQAVTGAQDLICTTFPEATPVWTKQRMENLAGALARCDAAYGWGGIGGLFSNPLIALALASFPLAVGTVKAINAAAPKEPARMFEQDEALIARDKMSSAAGAA